MAEDRTSVQPALSPSDKGQAMTSDAAPSSKGTEQSSQQAMNWQDAPEFRKYQSERDRAEAQLRGRNAELERGAEEATLAGMDDFDKTNYLAGKYRQRAEAAEQEIYRREQEAQKQIDIANLSEEYGIPEDTFDEIKQYGTYDAAVSLAKKTKALLGREIEKAVKERGEKVSRNAPDMGGGGYSKADTSTNVEAQRAMERSDPVALTRALREAKEQRR